DAEAWERLWVRSQLVLHAGGQALTCSLSAPCDLPAELVPCWQPVPAGPCQALPGLQQAAKGQGPQEFRGLQPHPNLCVQVGHSSARWLPHGCPTGTANPLFVAGVSPGHADDLLLLEQEQHGGNTLLCALDGGTCTPLTSFTSTVRGRDPHVPMAVTLMAQPAYPLLLLQGAGHPGLLEEELRRDVAAGQCRQVSAHSWWAAGMDRAACDMSPSPQIWHSENSTGVMIWACPVHKYLRTRWALAWMGVLLGAASLLFLLLLKKEDVKGWLKSLRTDCGTEGE
ncbi:I17RC protein, partial [Geococcyx californianus]|nr:I17RC protein [Geococcyx californianus]